MPTIYKPKRPHRCLEYGDGDLSKDIFFRIPGEIWECPECHSYYEWDDDFEALVPVPRWRRIDRRKGNRIIRRAVRAKLRNSKNPQP